MARTPEERAAWADLLVEIQARLPPNWERQPHGRWDDDENCIATWSTPRLGLIINLRTDSAGIWIHTSVSRRDRRLPTYHQVKRVKRIVFGPDREAVEIHSPVAEHVSLKEVRHLWGLLEGRCVRGDPKRRRNEI